MKTKEKQRRFDVFYPTVHGRKWIGASNILPNAMAIGEREGCRELGCPAVCMRYMTTSLRRIMLRLW